MAMKGNSFMHRVAELIVKLRWVFIILFVAAIVFSAFSVQWIQIENDIKAYLPDSSEAKQGLQIMNREFVTYGTAEVMVANVTPAQAQKLADRQVVVLPTRTVPMGITALLNFDPSVNAETNTINMMAAADKVSTGLITYAARDSEYDGKRIRKGEIMALENGKIVSTSTDITKATYRLARNMCKKDSSFVTIISGCDVSDEDAEKVTEIVKAKCPNHVEVSHIRGGQPVYYYMISVE